MKKEKNILNKEKTKRTKKKNSLEKTLKKTNSVKKKTSKRNTKSSVFVHLFSIPKYKKQLYLSLHPDDKNIDEKEIKTWTLSSIFTNIQINDLGLLVRDTLLVLVEAQSSWTLNILPRMLEYLAESFNRYVLETNQNIYGSKNVKLPRPELYVLYTGKKKIKEETISLKKEFFNNNSPIDVIVKVITFKNSNKIVKEYIKFTKILDKNNQKYGYTKQSIYDTIKYCKENNILVEYLNEYSKEVYNIMTSVYDQRTATEMYKRESFAEGREEGIQQGILKGVEKGRAEGMQQGILQGTEQGEIAAFVKLYKKGLIKIEDAVKMLNISSEKFLKLAK